MICHVNLIPINKIENGVFSKSTNENIIKFRDYLNDYSEKFKHRKTENDKVVLSKYDELNKLKDLLDKKIISKKNMI